MYGTATVNSNNRKQSSSLEFNDLEYLPVESSAWNPVQEILSTFLYFHLWYKGNKPVPEPENRASNGLKCTSCRWIPNKFSKRATGSFNSQPLTYVGPGRWGKTTWKSSAIRTNIALSMFSRATIQNCNNSISMSIDLICCHIFQWRKEGHLLATLWYQWEWVDTNEPRCSQ